MKLQQTQDYLLFIDEEASIKDHKWVHEGNKIIAYYPLTKEAKELDLPLLPNPFEEEIDMISLLDKDIPSCWSSYGKGDGTMSQPEDYNRGHRDSWIKGYKAAQSKQFSLEDVRKAIKMAKGLDIKSGVWFKYDTFSEEEIIQSLSTQRLPKEFIVEYKKGFRKNSDGEEIGFPVHKTVELKTITNSEGKKELVGTYKY